MQSPSRRMGVVLQGVRDTSLPAGTSPPAASSSWWLHQHLRFALLPEGIYHGLRRTAPATTMHGAGARWAHPWRIW